jgi:hypothetical protein
VVLPLGREELRTLGPDAPLPDAVLKRIAATVLGEDG